MKYKVFLVIILLFSISLQMSCNKDDFAATVEKTGIRYFSVKDFIYTQWKKYDGPGFAIMQIVKTDDKIDTTYTNDVSLDWSDIIKTFVETDITRKACLGRYTVSQFEENETMTENIYYKLIEDDQKQIINFNEEMLTQKLLITVNYVTNKLTGIYIETLSRSPLGETTQKLYYQPMKLIQMQRYFTPTIGEKKYLVKQYYFMGT